MGEFFVVDGCGDLGIDWRCREDMEIFFVIVADLSGSCLTAHKSLLRLVYRRIEVEDQKPQIAQI